MIDATRRHSFNSFVRMMYAYRGLRTHGVTNSRGQTPRVLFCQKKRIMMIVLSLGSLGVRLGRNGREAWADYQKPLGGLHGGFWPKFVDVRILYGNFSKYKVLMASSWARVLTHALPSLHLHLLSY